MHDHPIQTCFHRPPKRLTSRLHRDFVLARALAFAHCTRLITRTTMDVPVSPLSLPVMLGSHS